MSKGESVTVQLKEILDEYSGEVVKATNAAIDKDSKEAVRKLRDTSPKRPGRGNYARGWRTKKEKGAGDIYKVTVHNPKHYQLTHLLEKGHVIRNKYGTYGRTAARPHIKPVEEWAQSELPEEIERRLK